MSEQILDGVGQSTREYQLKTKDGKFRWQMSSGEWVSPEYSAEEAASWCHCTANPHRIPFLTDDEWRIYHPLPHVAAAASTVSPKLRPPESDS